MLPCLARAGAGNGTLQNPVTFFSVTFAGFRILNNSIKQSHSLETDSCVESQGSLHLNPGRIRDRVPEVALRDGGNP
jgi:hypothetical protein